jgi:hypothetical protein
LKRSSVSIYVIQERDTASFTERQLAILDARAVFRKPVEWDLFTVQTD